jgi:hypothetical protein
MISYPASTGRNFTEILRVIDSLQIGDKYRITTPVDWNKGDDVIVHPSVKSGEEAEKLFPGYKTVKVCRGRRGARDTRCLTVADFFFVGGCQPYLRFAKDPSTAPA